MANFRWVISLMVQYDVRHLVLSLVVPRALHHSYIARPRSFQRHGEEHFAGRPTVTTRAECFVGFESRTIYVHA